MLDILKSFILKFWKVFSTTQPISIAGGKGSGDGTGAGDTKTLEATDLPPATQPKTEPAPPIVSQAPPPPVLLQRIFTADELKCYGSYKAMLINQFKRSIIETSARAIILYKETYMDVEAQTTVPWWFIGLLHMKEADFDFKTHLHNGDPLWARTVHEPRGRPRTGKPPFQWVDSAEDAILFDGLQGFKTWDVISALMRAERYNGLGYRKFGINSPYLWAFTNQYSKGYFTSDGVYDSQKVAASAGVAPVIERLIELGVDIPMVHPKD